MTKKIYLNILLLSVIVLSLGACEKDFSYTLPPKAPPKVSQATTTLEAYYASAAPIALNSPYWKTANFLTINTKDVSTGSLYGDGALNMTNTFSGLTNFSKGGDSKLTLKAGYDANYLYILAEWYDSTVNLSQHSWIYNGYNDPLKPSDPNNGWTSQRNSDKFAMAFEIASAIGTKGNFATVGCEASCHGSGNTATMTPNSGSVDIWNWSLATSAPLGYAHDMTASSAGLVYDAGDKLATRNSNGSTDRSGPAYEWDGTSQSVTLPNGSTALLDPSYYLLNKTTMKGNVSNGLTIYESRCETCHGPNGSGAEAGAINAIGQNKKARKAYFDAMDNVADMSDYWGALSSEEKDDIVAYLRGLSGSPGHYLTVPTAGSSSADIVAISNVTPTQISNSLFTSTNHHQKYQVLIKRKLKTTNPDDVQFDLNANKNYVFGVALMDNDGKNHIGSVKETLTFK